MSKTAKSKCPKCGSEIIVEAWVERHRVHNGIGMQTVSVDYHTEVVEVTCNHQIGNFTDDEWEELRKEAASNYKTSKDDYYSEEYDRLKDEGKIQRP